MSYHKEELEGVRKSIEHWKRMIDWVKCYAYAEKPPLTTKMFTGIKETWSSEYCNLCQLHIDNQEEESCEKCILDKMGRGCKSGNPSPWKLVHCSKTWNEWYYNAVHYMLPALIKCEKFLVDEIKDLELLEKGKWSKQVKIIIPEGTFDKKESENMEHRKAIKLEPRDVLGIPEGNILKPDITYLAIRAKGCFKDLSFYLNEDYDWIIVKDDEDKPCLLRLTKGTLETLS